MEFIEKYSRLDDEDEEMKMDKESKEVRHQSNEDFFDD